MHPICTLKLPYNYPKLTLELPWSYPGATLELPYTYPGVTCSRANFAAARKFVRAMHRDETYTIRTASASATRRYRSRPGARNSGRVIGVGVETYYGTYPVALN